MPVWLVGGWMEDCHDVKETIITKAKNTTRSQKYKLNDRWLTNNFENELDTWVATKHARMASDQMEVHYDVKEVIITNAKDTARPESRNCKIGDWPAVSVSQVESNGRKVCYGTVVS